LFLVHTPRFFSSPTPPNPNYLQPSYFVKGFFCGAATKHGRIFSFVSSSSPSRHLFHGARVFSALAFHFHPRLITASHTVLF
jgi:hypothetical protein